MKETLAIGLQLSESVESSRLRSRTGTRTEHFWDGGRTPSWIDRLFDL